MAAASGEDGLEMSRRNSRAMASKSVTSDLALLVSPLAPFLLVLLPVAVAGNSNPPTELNHLSLNDIGVAQ